MITSYVFLIGTTPLFKKCLFSTWSRLILNSITLIENEIKRQISFESDIAHLLNFHGLIFMSGTSFFL